MSPAVTLACCTTGDRPGRAAVLAALAAEARAGDEVLVVVNGPRRASIDRDLALLPRASVVDEPRLGIARARATALERAVHDLVLFVDDDVAIQPGWRDALTAALHGDPGAGAAGGPIALDWGDDGRPIWLDHRLDVLFGGRPPGSRHPPFGANFALRRSVADAVGGFDLRLGRTPDGGSLHEETELCERIAAAGHAVVEAPGAAVRHPVLGAVTRRRVLDLAAVEGRSDAIRDRGAGGGDPGRRAAKAVGLVLALPGLALLPRRRWFHAARLVVNVAYLRTWRTLTR